MAEHSDIHYEASDTKVKVKPNAYIADDVTGFTPMSPFAPIGLLGQLDTHRPQSQIFFCLQRPTQRRVHDMSQISSGIHTGFFKKEKTVTLTTTNRINFSQADINSETQQIRFQQ